MLEIFGNTPPKVNIDTKMENVSPFKYGVILGSYVKFQGGNPCCQYSPNILFVQMSPFVVKLIVAGQSLYSKIIVGKQKNRGNFWNLMKFPKSIQISNDSDFGQKKERKAHQFKGKRIWLIRTNFQIWPWLQKPKQFRNPPNQPVLLRTAFDANLIMLPW